MEIGVEQAGLKEFFMLASLFLILPPKLKSILVQFLMRIRKMNLLVSTTLESSLSTAQHVQSQLQNIMKLPLMRQKIGKM